jgi:hypothetical protein
VQAVHTALNAREQVLRLKARIYSHVSHSKPNIFGSLIIRRSLMTKIKLLSAGLIATAMLATPVMAREHTVASRHAAEANASVFPTDGRACIPAPRVGSFAGAPWGGNNVPCEPQSY